MLRSSSNRGRNKQTSMQLHINNGVIAKKVTVKPVLVASKREFPSKDQQ